MTTNTNNKLTDETLSAWKTEAKISLGETARDSVDYSHHEAILALVTEIQEHRKAAAEPVLYVMGMGYAFDAETASTCKGAVDSWVGEWNQERLPGQEEYKTVPLYTAPPASERERIRREHAEWSDKTFGDVGPVGPLKHLSKEALEAAAEPDDISEWADMQFLLWDAQRRAGISDSEITAAMVEKLEINKSRQWPEPKDGEPRLHINEQPAPVDKEFIPKNLDKALGVVGVALPESKEEFNFQTERWIQRLIDRVIRYADEFKEQPMPVVPEDISGIIERFQYQADHLSDWHHIDEHSCKVNRRDLMTALEFMDSCRAALLNGDIFRENSISSTNNVREIAETSTNSPVIPESSFSGLVNSEYVTNLEDALRVAAAPQQEVKSALEHGMQRYAGAMQKLSEGDK